eukprot:CAMPEP_0194356018 /NCGR_PEP_ID=MMETSP0174-20130528/3833_1 /TAXON_ID=216777 /ORGANISM="Proboscia alata, Strain PI-D3" /LENGTH=73 /DNA_ID=CAMNT_0039125519 /DNA_START=320 /DNA_END=541 /DNA_ORIENTATION=-
MTVRKHSPTMESTLTAPDPRWIKCDREVFASLPACAADRNNKCMVSVAELLRDALRTVSASTDQLRNVLHMRK